MYRTCWSLYELSQTIRDLLANYAYDHEGLIRFIDAVIAGSAPVNLLELLGKSKGRFKVGAKGANTTFDNHPHLDILCDYLIDRIEERV